MQIQVFAFNPFQENTYILYDDTKACAIIDPGCYTATEQIALSKFIADNNLEVKLLLNTHCHIDHVLGNAYVANKYKVLPMYHATEEPYLKAVSNYAPNYGMTYEPSPLAKDYIAENGSISFGNTILEILFVPGHAPGHVAFYHKNTGQVINGDCLFRTSIGRTDLPGGNHETLLNSIRTKLFTLPAETIVYCGHGPETTIGFEIDNNPFF